MLICRSRRATVIMGGLQQILEPACGRILPCRWIDKRDRYLIISQKNVVPYVGGPMNLDVDWLEPGMESTRLSGKSPNTASA